MTAPAYLIVGATGGIGAELCRKLAAAPCKLVLAASGADRLDALAESLRSPTVEVVTRPLDATDPAAVDDAFAAAGPLNGVANLCGSILLKPAHLTTDRDFADTLAANLLTAFHVVRAAARVMTGGGSVALVSSCAAAVGLPNHEAIAAAKAGVEGLVRAAAATYAARGLRVNAVAPGLVRTPLSARITGSEAALKASTALHPLGRIGEPADVAAALAWLLNPATSWVTGQVVGVDGGLAAVRGR